jgi:hypothetical protein
LVGLGYGEQEIAPEVYLSLTRFPAPEITIVDAIEASGLVLDGAGATMPLWDQVDLGVVSEVRANSGFIIDSPADVGGYPEFTSGAIPADTDHDGMTDSWEQAMNLDPKDPTDGNEDMDDNGYSNIEEYLFSLLK